MHSYTDCFFIPQAINSILYYFPPLFKEYDSQESGTEEPRKPLVLVLFKLEPVRRLAK